MCLHNCHGSSKKVVRLRGILICHENIKKNNKHTDLVCH